MLAVTLSTPTVLAQERGVGGTQFRRNAGPYEIIVAQDVSALSIGTVVVTVAVLDAFTGENVPNAIVTVRTKHAKTGEEGQAFAVNYTSSTSYEAQINLSRPGRWDISVEVASPLGRVSVEGLPVNIQTVRGFSSGSFVFIGVSAVLILGVAYVWWSARREQQRRASIPVTEEPAEQWDDRGP